MSKFLISCFLVVPNFLILFTNHLHSDVRLLRTIRTLSKALTVAGGRCYVDNFYRSVEGHGFSLIKFSTLNWYVLQMFK